MVTKYRIKTSSIQPGLQAGDIVYGLMYHDYGLASDDTRNTGVDHISVTLDTEGNYPSFTIPRHALEKVE